MDCFGVAEKRDARPGDVRKDDIQTDLDSLRDDGRSRLWTMRVLFGDRWGLSLLAAGAVIVVIVGGVLALFIVQVVASLFA